MFTHPERDMIGVVRRDDFIWEGVDKDLDWILKVLESEYELKNRGRLGLGKGDIQEIDMLGRIITIDEGGISWKVDPRHLNLLVEYFGMKDNTKILNKIGYEEDEDKKDGEEGVGEGRGPRVPHARSSLELYGPRQPSTAISRKRGLPMDGEAEAQGLRCDQAADQVLDRCWGGGV